MNFITWHYSNSPRVYLKMWQNNFAKTSHFFSFPFLFKTLFAPWKRLTLEDETTFNINRWFENLTFNLISISIGFTVRLILIFTCLVTFLFIFSFGLLFLPFYILIPLFSIKHYSEYHSKLLSSPAFLFEKLKQKPLDAGVTFVDSRLGKFIISHFPENTDLCTLLKKISLDVNKFDLSSPGTSPDLVSWLIGQDHNLDKEIKQLGISSSDLVTAARWWDLLLISSHNKLDDKDLGWPGIGMELFFGYSPNIDKNSENLNIKPSFFQNLIGRTRLVDNISTILNSGRNILLVGDPGVGKMTVVYEFVHRALSGVLGSTLSFKRYIKLDFQSTISSGDNENKRLSFRSLLKEAGNVGNIILVIKDIHRFTNPDMAGFDFTDLITDFLEKSSTPIIALSNTADFQRYLSRDSRLMKFFDVVEVIPPSKTEALDILLLSASDKENKHHLTFSLPALLQLLNSSDRYITETPFPEKILELLTELTTHQLQTNQKIIDINIANQFLSQKIKVPLERLNESEKSKLSQLEIIIHKSLFGQDSAVSLIAKSLRSQSVGLKDENRPLGSFLFLGPTGVGKTETAKVLSQVYFGASSKILRFDMAEYNTPEGVERLIGSSARNLPGALTTAIKNSPSSLLLLDEIEKAPSQIYNLLLTLLDEGYLTDSFSQKIRCSNLFVVATSNAGAEFIRQQVSAGVSGDELQKSVLDHVQKTNIFSPELLNRFDGVIVYEPLSLDNLINVTRNFLTKLEQKLMDKNITLEYDDSLINKLIKENYDPVLGARPLHRAVELTLADIISKPILSGEVANGDHLVLGITEAKDGYTCQKSLKISR